MCFVKMGIEINPYFLDRRKTIPGIDGSLELSVHVDNGVCL